MNFDFQATPYFKKLSVILLLTILAEGISGQDTEPPYQPVEGDSCGSRQWSPKTCKYNDPDTNEVLDVDICGYECPPLPPPGSAPVQWLHCSEIEEAGASPRLCKLGTPFGQPCKDDFDCVRAYIPKLENPPLPIRLRGYCYKPKVLGLLPAEGKCKACIPWAYPCGGSKLPCCNALTNGAGSTFKCQYAGSFTSTWPAIWPLCSPDLCSKENYEDVPTGYIELVPERCYSNDLPSAYQGWNLCNCSRANTGDKKHAYSCQNTKLLNLNLTEPRCKKCGIVGADCGRLLQIPADPPCCKDHKCSNNKCVQNNCVLPGLTCSNAVGAKPCCPSGDDNKVIRCEPTFNYCTSECGDPGEVCLNGYANCCDVTNDSGQKLNCIPPRPGRQPVCEFKNCAQEGETCDSDILCCGGRDNETSRTELHCLAAVGAFNETSPKTCVRTNCAREGQQCDDDLYTVDLPCCDETQTSTDNGVTTTYTLSCLGDEISNGTTIGSCSFISLE